MLFAGTSDGSLRAIKYPIESTHEYQEHTAHSSSINRLILTHDDQFLFSISDDGCIFMYRVTDKDAKKPRDFIYADEVLLLFPLLRISLTSPDPDHLR